MADPVELDELLGNLSDKVKDDLGSTVEVVDRDEELDVNNLPITARRWHKVNDLVAVVVDLKNSTKLGVNKWTQSTAKIYEAATGGAVKVFDKFQADFIQIQGDGVFGLFWGDTRYERAMCAGITVKTFSEDLVKKLEDKWESLPETGYKVGVASSSILVKRVGTPKNPAQQEPVWAGKAVNYAFKAAQGVDRHQLAVAGSVWDRVEKNDYLAASCSCGDGPSLNIWSDLEIEKIPEGDSERAGRVLSATWCKIHGDEYCKAVMEGRKRREEVNPLRKALEQSQFRDALRAKRRRDREAKAALLNVRGR